MDCAFMFDAPDTTIFAEAPRSGSCPQNTRAAKSFGVDLVNPFDCCGTNGSCPPPHRNPRRRCGRYSRLMGADEEETHERLKAHLPELLSLSSGGHRGRIVKNTSD